MRAPVAFLAGAVALEVLSAVPPLVVDDAAAVSEAEAEKMISEICAGRPALVCGGTLLANRRVDWLGEQLTLAEAQRRFDGLQATSEALGPQKGFRPKDWWPAVGWETVKGGRLAETNGALHIVSGGRLKQWDTWYAKVNPYAPGDDLLVVEARSDDDDAQMSVELDGPKGERWFATLELGRKWSHHVLSPASFVHGAKTPPFDPAKTGIVQIALGVSEQFTPRMTDRVSSVHVRFMGSLRSPVSAHVSGQLPFDRFPSVEGVWPAYKTYQGDGRVCLVDRPTGEGFGRGNVWRHKRLGNAAESILIERRPGRPERCVARFGYAQKGELDSPEVRARKRMALECLSGARALLFEAGTDRFVAYPGESLTVGASWRGAAKTLSVVIRKGGETVFERQVADLGAWTSWSCAWTPPSSSATYGVSVRLDGDDEISHTFAVIDRVPDPKEDFVTASGGDFWLKGTKWYPVSVNFWPLYSSGTEREDYWNKWLANGYYSPNLVVKDLDAFVALGGNAVAIQPAPRGSERNMTDFFRLCRERGVRVNLHVPLADPYQFNETALTNLLVESRASADATVFAYDTSWEPGNHIFNAGRRNRLDGAWRRWIADQFGSVDAAETAWGARLPRNGKGEVTSPPNEAFTGGDAKWNRLMASYRRFMDNETSHRWNRTKRALRRHAPCQLVSFRQGNTLPWDFALTGPIRHLDFVCPEGYSFANTDEHENSIGWITRYIDAYSQGKPIIWSEFGISVWNRLARTPDVRLFQSVADYSERFYRTGLAAGANGFSPWWWPGGYRSDERSDYGIVNEDRTPRPAARLIERFAAAVKAPRTRPAPGEWMDFDRDADAGGYCKAAFGSGGKAYGAAKTKGRLLGVRLAGVGLTSVTAPALALGDVPLVGQMPAKYLDADFDAVAWRRLGPDRISVEVELGNPGPADWAPASVGTGGVRLVAADAATGRELAALPLPTTVPRFGETGRLSLVVPASAKTSVVLRLEAQNRFFFGERRILEGAFQ